MTGVQTCALPISPDETVKAAKMRETEHEQLVGGLVSEAERVNEIILSKNVSSPFLF